MDYAELPGWDAAGLPDDDEDERYPHMRARKRFGNISIANADAASNAMLEAAVEQAHRAVTELLSL
jgi:spermidine dehydrogenase